MTRAFRESHLHLHLHRVAAPTTRMDRLTCKFLHTQMAAARSVRPPICCLVGRRDVMLSTVGVTLAAPLLRRDLSR